MIKRTNYPKATKKHFVLSNGDLACGGNYNTVGSLYGKDLSSFINGYNQCSDTYCENCRNAIKAAQVQYKAKNNGSLRGFKM